MSVCVVSCLDKSSGLVLTDVRWSVLLWIRLDHHGVTLRKTQDKQVRVTKIYVPDL